MKDLSYYIPLGNIGVHILVWSSTKPGHLTCQGQKYTQGPSLSLLLNITGAAKLFKSSKRKQ